MGADGPDADPTGWEYRLVLPGPPPVLPGWLGDARDGDAAHARVFGGGNTVDGQSAVLVRRGGLAHTVLTPTAWEAAAVVTTSRGFTLADLVRACVKWPGCDNWAYTGLGCPDAECYAAFAMLTAPLVERVHRGGRERVDIAQRHPETAADADAARLPMRLHNMETLGGAVSDVRLVVRRNLNGFGFCTGGLSIKARKEVEAAVAAALVPLERLEVRYGLHPIIASEYGSTTSSQISLQVQCLVS